MDIRYILRNVKIANKIIILSPNAQVYNAHQLEIFTGVWIRANTHDSDSILAQKRRTSSHSLQGFTRDVPGSGSAKVPRRRRELGSMRVAAA